MLPSTSWYLIMARHNFIIHHHTSLYSYAYVASYLTMTHHASSSNIRRHGTGTSCTVPFFIVHSTSSSITISRHTFWNHIMPRLHLIMPPWETICIVFVIYTHQSSFYPIIAPLYHIMPLYKHSCLTMQHRTSSYLSRSFHTSFHLIKPYYEFSKLVTFHHTSYHFILIQSHHTAWYPVIPSHTPWCAHASS